MAPGNEHFKALTAHARMNAVLMHGFLFINKRLLISCDMGIYAIILIITHSCFTGIKTNNVDFKVKWPLPKFIQKRFIFQKRLIPS